MAVDPREGLFELTGFGGLRNNIDPSDFELGDLENALNCDIDDGENVTRRRGFSTAITTAIDRNLFAVGSVCLGVGSNALKRILPDFSVNTLKTGLTVDRDLSYAAISDRVYWANGIELGVVSGGVNRSWGLPVPATPTVALSGGDLPEGTYQFAVTFIRDDGQESGAARAGSITLAAIGGISLSAIPVATDATIIAKAVYVSTRNGSALFRAGLIANATTVFAVREPGDPAAPLQTQFLSAPPAGDFIGYFKGWMLVAKGNRLYPSEVYAPELFDSRKSIPFLDRITMVAPMNDKTGAGVWIGTDTQVIWLTGNSPETWEYKVAASSGVIPGTLAYSESKILGDDSGASAQIVYFTTKQGICVGRANGGLIGLTQDRFSFPAQPIGAGVVRNHRGTVQYVVTLNGPETAANVFV